MEAEAQTLVALTKSRDVQSAVLVTRGMAVQATAWDISDTFRALDEVGRDQGGGRAAAHQPAREGNGKASLPS